MNLRSLWAHTLIVPAVLWLLTGCTASHYRKSADREMYNIIAEKEDAIFGGQTDFTIDTPYSHREPQDIEAAEIIHDRVEKAEHVLTLDDALAIAAHNNRQYQLRKENLYLAALSLSRERYQFRPRFFAGTTVAADRMADGTRARVNTDVGARQLLRTGGSIGVDIANDLLRYYTGDQSRTAVSVISVNLLQPLLRGAGKVAVEALTQAERDMVYEVRAYSHFQNAFALDVVTAYLRLLQQQDSVQNEYNNYLGVIEFRKRAVALAEEGRTTQVQVDQARQDELRAQSRYILAVERYLASVDQFKITLGLPLTHEVRLDDQDLEDIRRVGLLPLVMTPEEAFGIAVESRLDIFNEIDRFEDSKRRIEVAASQLKADLNLFASASLRSQGVTDYASFDINDWRGSAGLELNLPIDRLPQRNAYRSTIINFERQLRSLSLTLDTLRDSVNQGLRALDQARQTYDIQLNARNLAERRVESADLLFELGRIEARDHLDAQNAQLQARNAVTQALVDYHLARLRLLLDIGELETDVEQFWLRHYAITDAPPPLLPDDADADVPTPEELFGLPL